jgi:hypothetical protein
MHDVHTMKQLVEKETGPKELPPNLQSSTLLEAPLDTARGTTHAREVVETFLFGHFFSFNDPRQKKKE